MTRTCLSVVLFFCVSAWADAETIRFCRPNNMVSAHAYIAEREGYFKKRDVDIKFLVATNAKICQDMLLGRGAEIMVGAEAPFTVAAPYNPPFKIIADVGISPETAIFARSDRGISDFASLKGKKIGYLPGSASHFFLGRVLKAHGIKNNEVTLLSLQPPALSQALIGGNVDAISIWEPWGYLAKKELGEKFIRLEAPKLYQYHQLLTVREEYAHRDEIAKILSAYIEAEEYLKKHPAEAQLFLSDAIKLDLSILKELWPQHVFDVTLSDAPLQLIRDNFALLQEGNHNFSDLVLGDPNRFIESSVLKKIDAARVKQPF